MAFAQEDSMRFAISAFFALSVLLARPAGAHDVLEDRGVEVELHRLNATVAQMNAHLARLVAQQEAALYVRRLELAAARVDDIDARLERTRKAASDSESAQLMMEQFLGSLEDELEDADGEKAEQLRARLEMAKLEVQTQRDEAARLGNRSIELENERRRRNDELVALQELLDASLTELLRSSQR